MNEEKYITREELKEHLELTMEKQQKLLQIEIENNRKDTLNMLREAITVISDRMMKRTESFEKNIEKLLQENNLMLKKLGMHDERFDSISKAAGGDNK